jgi:hypothetical protein
MPTATAKYYADREGRLVLDQRMTETAASGGGAGQAPTVSG